MNKLIASLSCAMFLLAAAPAEAILLAFEPPSQTVPAGGPATLSLRISGLDAPNVSLGGFDVDVGFDSAILSLRAVIFGDPTLGDQLDISGFGPIICAPGYGTSPGCPANRSASMASLQGGGMANLLELSLDLASVLNAGQADSFILATLVFETLTQGQAVPSITRAVLADAFGAPLTADIQSAQIIAAPPNGVPAPSSLALLMAGMAALGYRRRARLRRRSLTWLASPIP